MKKITILGSTGSIGTSALKVIEANPDRYLVQALTAGNNIELLFDQILRFRPEAVAVSDERQAGILRDRLKGKYHTEVLSGVDGFIKIACLSSADTIISAMSGAAGLVPTFEAIKAGKEIALANKETMVMAGSIIMDTARKHGVSILPIDSEHSAVFQSLQGHDREDVKRVILTASGGPFRNLPENADMASITPAMALRHPNWDMGRKITIDSATMMNKGLEVIEAKWLFDLNIGQIEVLIHPESIIHSMVEYADGSIIAQMGIPDMITPISYALSYPRHIETGLPSLRLEEIGRLTFHRPDKKRFECLSLAISAIEAGGTMPAVMNGANEIAVEAFLDEKIGFPNIPHIIEKTMEAHNTSSILSMEEVLEADSWARATAKKELSLLMN